MSKKIPTFILIIISVFFLSGCGNRKGDNNELPKLQKPAAQEEKMPAATGNVDDTVNAIIEESNLEKNLVSGTDEVAKNAINDSQETDDFANSYDENEF